MTGRFTQAVLIIGLALAADVARAETLQAFFSYSDPRDCSDARSLLESAGFQTKACQTSSDGQATLLGFDLPGRHLLQGTRMYTGDGIMDERSCQTLLYSVFGTELISSGEVMPLLLGECVPSKTQGAFQLKLVALPADSRMNVSVRATDLEACERARKSIIDSGLGLAVGPTGCSSKYHDRVTPVLEFELEGLMRNWQTVEKVDRKTFTAKTPIPAADCEGIRSTLADVKWISTDNPCTYYHLNCQPSRDGRQVSLTPRCEAVSGSSAATLSFDLKFFTLGR